MNVLVISPHPDDEVLGCGGTIRRLADAGQRVTIAIVTRGWAPLFSEAQVQQVREEARAAAAALGAADLRFLDLPVTKLAHLPEHELNGALMRLVDDVRPEWVFLPFRSDVHEDHRQIFDAALVALRPTPPREFVTRIMCYETLSETHWAPPGIEPPFDPQIFVDISATLPAKLAAMKCYASQLRPAPNARSLESMEALARFRGMTIHVAAAEAFVLIREIMPAGAA